MSDGAPSLHVSPGGKKRRLDRVTGTTWIRGLLRPIIDHALGTSSFGRGARLQQVDDGLGQACSANGGEGSEDSDDQHLEGAEDVSIEQTGDAVVHSAGDIFLASSFRAGTSHDQTTAADLSSAFDGVRADIRSKYLEALLRNNHLSEHRKEAVRASVVSAVANCGEACRSCHSHSVESERQVRVIWIGAAYRFEVQVPVWKCAACLERFSCNALDVACMPGTPVHAWDLTKVPAGAAALWFDLSLVKVCPQANLLNPSLNPHVRCVWFDLQKEGLL